MHIISASRRTDIPHYYASWFGERRKAGFAEYRTVFGGGKDGRFRASMKDEDVLGYLFWTKFAAPFHEQLTRLRSDGIPYVFQYTITGYGREIQPDIPEYSAVIDDFLQVARTLPDATAIQWRYDPIIISDRYDADWHRNNFDRISQGLQGATRVVNVSFIEPYLKALSKAPDWRAIRWRQIDPERHKSTLRKYPGIASVGANEHQLLNDLRIIAERRGMELRVCCNQEYTGEFPVSACCGQELFEAYGSSVREKVLKLAPGPSRPGCHCLKTIDIGMDTTCPAGCFYCYVTTSLERATNNHSRHDQTSPMLR